MAHQRPEYNYFNTWNPRSTQQSQYWNYPFHAHFNFHPYYYHHHYQNGHNQFRNNYDLAFDNCSGAVNPNFIRSYLSSQVSISKSLARQSSRRQRTIFTPSQIADLEQHFQIDQYLTVSRLADLSNQLNLSSNQINIWFKNRRRRHKIHQELGWPLASQKPRKSKNHFSDPLRKQRKRSIPTPSTSTRQGDHYYEESYNGFYNCYVDSQATEYWDNNSRSSHKKLNHQSDFNNKVNTINDKISERGVSAGRHFNASVNPKDRGNDCNPGNAFIPFGTHLSGISQYQCTMDTIRQAYNPHRNLPSVLIK